VGQNAVEKVTVILQQVLSYFQYHWQVLEKVGQTAFHLHIAVLIP